MAWRVDEHVVRGELDNRARGRVQGRIWFLGMDTPVEVDLAGNPWRDLAGHRIEFVNPHPKPGGIGGLNIRQCGSVGDMTASRKVKVPDCSPEELRQHLIEGSPFPWHWANSLHLEWFSGKNGRVIIETTAFQLTIDSEPAWTLTAEEEIAQQNENARAMSGFMDRLVESFADQDGTVHDADHPEHPLRELLDGVMIAGPKLAGALLDSAGEDEWSPDPLLAGNVLVRLKKARRHLENALLGIESAEAEQLASPQFLVRARRDISSILTEVRELIAEVRTSLGG